MGKKFIYVYFMILIFFPPDIVSEKKCGNKESFLDFHITKLSAEDEAKGR